MTGRRSLLAALHLRNIFWVDAPTLLRTMLFAGVILGPILGYVTLRCRSVWPAVCLHHANTLTCFLRH